MSARYSDGTVPYFTVTEETRQQVTKLLGGYWESLEEKIAFETTWDVYMAMAAGAGVAEDGSIIPVEWDGQYVFDPMESGDSQATYPARDILQLVMLGQNPYDFNGVNFVERLQGHSNGEPWANNIWYNMAAKAAGIEPQFQDSLVTNARSDAYDLDMRAWTIVSLDRCFGLAPKDMVEFIEGLHSVQATYENGISDEKYIGLFRGLAFYNGDGNPFTIGCVLSAIASVGGDPDVLFAYSYDGQTLNPLDQIEAILWDPDTGVFVSRSGGTGYVKDMIIGLGDILQGSNVWNRCALTEEKFNDLVAKAGDEAKAAALTGAELEAAPAYGEADYGKYYYFLYEAVADELEETGDTSMRPQVKWGSPVDEFRESVAALPEAEAEGFLDAVEGVIALYEKLYAVGGEAFTDAVRNSDPEGTDTLADYRAAVAAALKQQDETGDTADFYTRVMALPDALIITESSREEVDALRNLYDHMSDEQQALVDWAGKSVLLKLMAAEAVLGTPEDEEPKTMTISFTLLGAPNDGEEGEVNTLMDGNLELWYETEQTFNAESLTAEQVFRVVMGEAGIAWRGNSQNQYGSLYVSGIQNPRTGEWMEEFSTTPNSGWMYTVNGIHPSVGLSDWTLYDGDEFVVHFTDDFTKEEDAAQYNDESNSGSGSGSGSDSSGSTVGSETNEVELTAEEVRSAAETGEALTVETENGSVTLSPEALDALSETGSDVTVSVEKNADGTMTVDVNLDGETADVTVKAALPAAEENKVLVIVHEDGTEEVIKKSVVEDGTAYAEIPAGATVKAVDNSKDFGDVSENAWYADAVDFVSSHELFEGVDEGVFAPNDSMTRAMLVTVLFRLEDEPQGFTGVRFGDVAGDTWYTDAVAWASENDIVNGNGDGFAPNDNITREQIATVLYRYARYLGMDVSARGDVSSFGDGSEVSSWASDAMAWAIEVGLFEGDDAGNLNPKADATRAQVAALIERMVKLIVK